MIRFVVVLYFFIHLAVMIKAPRLKWASRLIGYGLAALFASMVIFSAEPNSNLVFVFCAGLAVIGVVAAEIVAGLFKKPKN